MQLENQTWWKFQHPFTARLVGPSGCGKTTFLSNIIEKQLIDPWPRNIIYCYGSSWQSPVFDRLQSHHGVKFQRGFDENTLDAIESPALVICDDLILEMRDSAAAANLFTRESHHRDLSVFLLEQSLFPRGKQSVTMKTNTSYTVIFKSPSDALGIQTLSRHLFPSSYRFLVDSFHDCTREPFTYIIVDTKQRTPNDLRVVTDILTPCPTVYVPKSKEVDQIISRFNGGAELRQEHQSPAKATIFDQTS